MADKTINEARKFTQYAGTVAASLGGLAMGVTLTWSSSAADHLTSCNATREDCLDFPVTADDFSWISSLLSIGAVVGATVTGQTVDIFGRKTLLLVVAALCTVGWALITWAQAVWMYMLGRAMTGLGTGTFSLVSPMFITEISEKSIRGALGTFFQVLNTLGMLLLYVFDYAFQWNFIAVNILCLLTPIMLGVAMLFLPETPRYQLLKGNKEESIKSLKFYRGEDYNIEQELEEMETALNEEKKVKTQFFTAIRSKAAVRGVVLSAMTMFFQQSCGSAAVVFYASAIFAGSGISLDPKLASVLLGVFLLLSSFGSVFVMDRAGRKTLLLVSGGIMTVANLVLAVYLLLNDQKRLGGIDINWLPVVAVVVFICAFSIGYGPISFLYVAEVFSPQIKGPAMSISLDFNWVLVFFITKFFDSLTDAIQLYGVFFLFGGISAVGFVCVSLFFIETSNKSLEQVQDELSGRKAISKGAGDYISNHLEVQLA